MPLVPVPYLTSGSLLPSDVMADSDGSSKHVVTDSCPLSPTGRPPIWIKNQAGDRDKGRQCEDSPEGSYYRFPVEAEEESSRGKPSSVPLDKAEKLQDDEVSSSSKPKEIEFDENNFPVNLDTMKFEDVIIPPEDFPEWKKDGQYDGLLVFHEKDEEKASYFRRTLQSHLRPDGEPIKICRLQEDLHGKNESERLEYYCGKSTYLMMFLTKNFCEDQTWSSFYQHRIIIQSVTDVNKKWCAIPVHTEYWRSPESYKTPFALQGIRGICLQDSHWEQGAVKMFHQRFKHIHERKQEEDRAFKKWYMYEQGRRLIQWKKDKLKFMNEKKETEERRQRELEAAINGELMDFEPYQPPNTETMPPRPGVMTQRNTGATAESTPPRRPVKEAWGAIPQVPSTGQHPPVASPVLMSYETMLQFQQFQAFLASQQMKSQQGPNAQLLEMGMTKNVGAGLFVGQPPVVIHADVVNMGDHNKTMIQKEKDDDDDDDDIAEDGP